MRAVPEPAPEPGDLAPDLQLPDLLGEETILHDHRGQVVLVSFLRHAG